MTKLTLKDFEFFKKKCLEWIDILGLTDCEYIFVFGTPQNSASLAETLYNYQARHVRIILNPEFKSITFKNIKEKYEYLTSTALHEVLEVLLMRLDIMAKTREWDEAEWNAETHAVIHRLVRVLLGNNHFAMEHE